MNSYPRVLLAAPSSGSGKTWITCGLLQAFINRGFKTASFKCGPDYIDPMFHSNIIGTVSKNLDSFFTEDEITKYLFCKTAKNVEISIIEGVMGYFDGIANTVKGSAYEIAQITHSPVILIINCKGMGNSVIPIIKGFLSYKKDSRIKGVILNQISSSLYPEIKKKIEEELSVTVYGYVPKMEKYKIESRHLGLVLPNEVDCLKENIEGLADVLEETVEIEKILELSKGVESITYKEPKISKLDCGVTIGVAMDEAFCFIYKDNLDLLEQIGAKLTYFSPVHDKELPNDLDGLLFYGGYPELYAKKLSENTSMREAIYNKIRKGMPYMAECGGFMYLHEHLEDEYRTSYPMVGVIHADCYKTEKLQRFGYIELCSNGKKIFGKEVEKLKGHEFHYYDSTDNGSSCIANKPFRNKKWECIHGDEKSIAGFPHLFYYSDTTIPFNFLKTCALYHMYKEEMHTKKEMIK